MTKRNGPRVTTPGAAPKQVAASATNVQSISGSIDILAGAARYDISELPPALAARIVIDPESSDWIWTGHIDKDGYGKWARRGAHCAVWEHFHGPVPDGLELDHREDLGCQSIRPCVFPGHLLAVTHRVNVLRGNSFAAINARKTECVHGHPFAGTNLYRWRNRRDCRQCARDRRRGSRPAAAQGGQMVMARRAA